MLAKGRTTRERLPGEFFRRRPYRFRLSRLSDFERIDVDWLGDVLHSGCAEIGNLEFEPPPHLPIGLLGETDRAGRRDAFQPRRDIHAVAHQIAVAFLNNVAEMDANSKVNTTLGGQTGVSLNHAVLHLDRASNRVHDAAEFDERPVASARCGRKLSGR